MSDRQAFFGLYPKDRDNDGYVCLCKTEAQANLIVKALQKEFGKFEVRHVEIVADINLDIRDY